MQGTCALFVFEPKLIVALKETHTNQTCPVSSIYAVRLLLLCIGCIVSLVAKNKYKHKISLKTICSKTEILTRMGEYVENSD